MIRIFSIENFKCFDSLKLKSLERVNLIAGANNTGKTALLEAVFLLIGRNNPALTLNINALRGIERFSVDSDEIWGWLFFNKATEKVITLAASDDQRALTSVRIRLARPDKRVIIPKIPPILEDETPMEQSEVTTAWGEAQTLEMAAYDAKKKVGTSIAMITPEGKIESKRATLKAPPKAVFLGARRIPKDDIVRFSNLERDGRQDEFLPIIKSFEPRLKRLTILVIGGLPIICGDIGLRELIPIYYMGEGVARLLSMVMAILTYEEGVILIDEIENGIHHSVMGEVWKALAGAAEKSNSQIFATTHSFECISAAHGVFASRSDYEFRLFRLDRIANRIQAVAYDKSSLDAATSKDLEVR